MGDKAKISDAHLVRLLGEYTAKAAGAYREYLYRRGLLSAMLVVFLAVFAAASIIAIATIEPVLGADKAAGTAYLITIVAITLVVMLVTTFILLKAHLRELKTSISGATWHLRRVYELVSRREDLGVELDSGTRLEMELRLSEAASVLTRLENFDRPQALAQFQRVGRSPLHEVQSEKSPLSPDANAALNDTAEPNSATTPNFSAT